MSFKWRNRLNLVASYAKKFVKNKFKCFSIKNEDKNYDETQNIYKSIKKLNVNHSYVDYDKKNSINHLEEIIKKTSSIVPTTTWLLYSKILSKIKKSGFKVVLGGAGGDELFAGYYIHHLFYLKSLRQKSKFIKYYQDWSKNVKPFVRSRYLNDYNFF